MQYRCITNKPEDDTGDMEDVSCISSPCIVSVINGTPKPNRCLYDGSFQKWEEFIIDGEDSVYIVTVELFGVRSEIFICKYLEDAKEYQRNNPVLKPKFEKEIIYMSFKAIRERGDRFLRGATQ